jgi:hypothetical protein
VVGSCGCCNEPWGPVRGGEFDWLSNYQLLKMGCAVWSYLPTQYSSGALPHEGDVAAGMQVPPHDWQMAGRPAGLLAGSLRAAPPRGAGRPASALSALMWRKWVKEREFSLSKPAHPASCQTGSGSIKFATLLCLVLSSRIKWICVCTSVFVNIAQLLHRHRLYLLLILLQAYASALMQLLCDWSLYHF